MDRTYRFVDEANLLVPVGWRGVGVVGRLVVDELAEDRLAGGRDTWVPCFQWLGCDFDHNYFSTRLWLEGGDPYEGFPRRLPPGARDKYVYPPIVLPCFAWCGLMPLRPALLVWWTVQASIVVLASVVACRVRPGFADWGQCLCFLPSRPYWAVTPCCSRWSVETATSWCCCSCWQCFGPAGASPRRDGIAGTCLALAAWIKIFPGIVLLAVLFYRRWRLAAVFAGVGLAIGLVNLPGNLAFARNLHEQSGITPDKCGIFFPWCHTLTGHWQLLARHLPFEPWLLKAPGPWLGSCWCCPSFSG